VVSLTHFHSCTFSRSTVAEIVFVHAENKGDPNLVSVINVILNFLNFGVDPFEDMDPGSLYHFP